MQSFLSVVYCLSFVAATVLFTLAAYSLFNRLWKKKYQPAGNEFSGIMFGGISLLYSLIIAFVIVAVWEDYEELNQTVEQEADKLNNIVIHAAVLPDSLKVTVDSTITHYCNQVINDWPTTGANTYHQANAIQQLRLLLLRTQPQNHLQENLFDVLDDALGDVSGLRRERVGHAHSHVPALVWLILLTGSILLIVFSFFISTESVAFRRIGISFLAALVGMSIFLVYSLDHPFNGSMQISNEPYKKVLLLLKENR